MAKKFEFRLEVVRTLRRRARDAQRGVVGEAARAVAGAQEHIAQLNNYLADATDQARRALAPGRLDLGTLKGQQLHRGWVERAVENTRADLQSRHDVLTQRRVELAEAAKVLKVIETLRDKRWAAHRLDIAREQQRDTDEAATQMFLRQRAAATCIGGLS